MRVVRFMVAVVLAVVMVAGCGERDASAPPSAPAGATAATVSAAAEARQPAGRPLVFTLTVRNQGPAPLTWYDGGPGEGPDGTCFRASVTGADGQSHPVALWNGHQLNAYAAFVLHALAPGNAQTVEVFAANPGPGSWTYAIAIDPSGNLWISNFGSNLLTEFVGLASPVKTPLITLPVTP